MIRAMQWYVIEQIRSVTLGHYVPPLWFWSEWRQVEKVKPPLTNNKTEK
jgi:hypothetical protein